MINTYGLNKFSLSLQHWSHLCYPYCSGNESYNKKNNIYLNGRTQLNKADIGGESSLEIIQNSR